ncbi:hypothetical protein LCGC14_1053100, partial [marine sediment metagenome]
FNANDTAEDAEAAVGKLEIKGCSPSQRNEKDIIAIKKDVASTDKTVKEMQTEQKAMRIKQDTIHDNVTYIRAKLENE